MGLGPSNNEVCAGSLASAEKGRAPTNRVASFVRTGETKAPASTIRLHTSTALYAAIPPETPSTTRRPDSAPTGLGGVGVGSALSVGFDLIDGLGPVIGDLGRRDLLEGDRQRLA